MTRRRFLRRKGSEEADQIELDPDRIEADRIEADHDEFDHDEFDHEELYESDADDGDTDDLGSEADPGAIDPDHDPDTFAADAPGSDSLDSETREVEVETADSSPDTGGAERADLDLLADTDADADLDLGDSSWANRNLTPGRALAVAAAIGAAAIAIAVSVAAITAQRDEVAQPVQFQQRAIIPDLPRTMSMDGYGEFEVNDGRVERTRRGDELALYLHDVGVSDGNLSVRADQSAVGFGFVFRAQDYENYWTVRARPWLSGWSLEKVTDGEPEVVGRFLRTSSNGPATIEIELSGRHVQVTIDDVSTFTGDTYLADATQVGFLAENRALKVLGWRDLRLLEVEPEDVFADATAG